MSIRITNVQRMCFDDGPGIRTTVFLKGCSLHCPWCSNPENISYEKQEFNNPKQEKQGIYGKDYEAEELLKELLIDRKYWGADGGVTFSGGEALLQAEALEPVWKGLKEEGIHIALETALFVPEKQVEMAGKYVDYFYVDAKILDSKACKEILGGDVAQYLKNVEKLAGYNADVHFRVPCSREYVLNDENVGKLLAFFRQYSFYPIELFAIHDLGRTKYETLGRTMQEFQEVPLAMLEALKEMLIQNGCQADIITI